MTIEHSFTIAILPEEWEAYPQYKRDRIKEILSSRYGIDVSELIEADEEDDEDGWN